jgi:hypothetical protein
MIPLAVCGLLLFLAQWTSNSVDNGGVVAYCIVVALVRGPASEPHTPH